MPGTSPRFATWMALAAIACAHAPPATVGPGACAQDAARLCPGVEQGAGKILDCLKRQPAALSGPCRLAVATPLEALDELTASCSDDAARVCPGVPPGGGRVLDCLRAGWNALSESCQAALWAAQEKRDQFESVCGKDVARRCQGVPPGEGRIVKCLRAQEADVSPPCRALVAP